MAEIIIPLEILSTYFPSTGGLPTEHPGHGGDKNDEILLGQIKHRVELVNFWSIPAGSKVLEIGCGQGDTTLVLAAQVRDEGHVDAVDPGDSDYGAPWTLSQAQSLIKSGPLGHRITFHNAFPIQFLESLTSSSSSSPNHQPTQNPNPIAYTHIILSHSTFYFSSPTHLPQLISHITSLISQSSSPYASPIFTKSTKLCIAEWDLLPTSLPQLPHLLAILLQAIQESGKKEGDEGTGNVRCVRSVRGMQRVLEERGWVVEKQQKRSVGGSFGDTEKRWRVDDGRWEVGNVGKWKERELQRLRGEKVRAVVGAENRLNVLELMYDVLDLSLENMEGGAEEVCTLGVWVSVFGVADGLEVKGEEKGKGEGQNDKISIMNEEE